ncbi:MAG: hypothetical protein JSV96_18285, partial [Candidatus Aminicenantes bacterium]
MKDRKIFLLTNKSSISLKTFLLIIHFFILTTFLPFSSLLAHPVFGEKIILTQPNGMKIVGYIYGDEYYHRIETEEGYT